MTGRVATALVLLLSTAPSGVAAGVVVAGRDTARILLPPGVEVTPYRNRGYALRVDDGVAAVEVELSPIGSRAPFQPLLRADPTPVERLAGALTWGSSTQHEAVTRLLAWVAGNIRYRLDRTESQEAAEVLERRTAYCTGFARLAVALLATVGIEAREVAGYVAGDRPAGDGAGFHRWIEVRYPDRGWVFSDPMATLGFVDATYLRIASDRLTNQAPGDGLLIARDDRTLAVDVAPAASAVAVRLRANDDLRTAAAVVVSLESGREAEAELTGTSVHRAMRLTGGRGSFLGLEPGRYEIRVREGGRLAAWQSIMIPDRSLAQVSIPRSEAEREESEQGR